VYTLWISGLVDLVIVFVTEIESFLYFTQFFGNFPGQMKV